MGFSRKAQSLPLTTGIYTHLAIAEVCQWILDARLKTGMQPERAPDEVVRWAAGLAVEEYQRVIGLSGLLQITQEDPNAQAELARTIQEQSTLIEGLVWAWCLCRLPVVLQEYLIVAVEEEQEWVDACSCGLGSGIGGFREHATRKCGGIGIESRPDLLLERRIDHAWCYVELKTASVAWKSWQEQFERNLQLLVGVLGAERRHGVEITHCRIEGLVKGQWKRDYPYEEHQPKTQQSPLCYAYHEPANPPLGFGDWLPAYEYVDREGIKHRVPKSRDSRYRKIGIWEADDDGFPGKPAWMSRSEWIVRYWAENYPYHLTKTMAQVGPIPKKRDQLDMALRSLICVEKLWQERLWAIYEWQVKNAGQGWGDPAFHAFVETVVPRSFRCLPYDGHPCPNIPICFQEAESWRDPVGSGAFLYRKPHHTAERVQAEARGWKPEVSQGVGEEEAGGEDA
ncbi:MAG: hypothetical protein DMF56_27055 [Acidobacteria bacterium]|nr:MAG: hypothetical protein DMF56_27055 [Acidobacteriota bacterium]